MKAAGAKPPLSAPSELRCEYLANPVGIDEPRPLLSWVPGAPPDGRRGEGSRAFQVLVASTPEKLAGGQGDLWDSGKVACSDVCRAIYGGKALASRKQCHWKVRVWDRGGKPAEWSAPAFWEMGLLQASDWQARWIGTPAAIDCAKTTPPPHLHRRFELDRPIARARLYASALGLYEIYLNGRRVGENQFAPGWTDYALRVPYQSYDVTDLLRPGANALGAVLADGWYAGFLTWGGKRNIYGQAIKLLCQLEVSYADGTSAAVNSDGTWKAGGGPTTSADIYNGESFDARLELPNWATSRFDDSGWRAAKVYPDALPRLCANLATLPRKIQELRPANLTEPKPGAWIFDLGQNMVGWARIAIRGPAGARVVVRYAEMLNPDGTLYTTNLRSAKSTDEYILKGGGTETWEPRFTFHGFRYVELTGLPERPELKTVTGIVVHSPLPAAGTFECSNPMLNQLQHNIQWGQKGNFLEVPTDCPQRDERLGWTGDAQVFIRTACFNADVAAFFTKWLVDLADSQSPSGAFPMVAPDVLGKREGDGGAAWAEAGVICPWVVYLCYADRRALERYYPSMKKYLSFLGTQDFRKRHCFGDWLNIDDPTEKDLIAAAFYVHTADLLARTARVLGRNKDASAFAKLAGRLRQRFLREFVTPEGRLCSGSQTAYVLALHFELAPPSLRPRLVERLVRRIEECNGHLSTGFVGASYLLGVLAKHGHLDLAYKLLLKEDFPSWGYPIKHGATTMWERWDGWRHDKGFQDPGMNSFNHYAYGAVGQWMYENIAGIALDSEAPGYRRILVRPRPGGGLTWARASLRTPRGLLATSWKQSKTAFTLELTVPVNSEAEVCLPAKSMKQVKEGGRALQKAPGVSRCKAGGGVVTCLVGSGEYSFTVS